MLTIKAISALSIIDSRGNPTVEATVRLSSGHEARAAVPSGASTGKREAVERRDGGKRYGGKGVDGAVNAVNNEIAPALIDQDPCHQTEIDALLCELDGTPNKSRLGANAILAVSLAVSRAHALAEGKSYFKILGSRSHYRLPVPMMNIINGGVHADNNLDIQEFMILPVAASSFSEALRQGCEIFHALKSGLHAKGYATAVGDEGGFAPDLPSHRAALDFIAEAVAQTGLTIGKDIYFALDAASSSFYESGFYHLKGENKRLESDALIAYYQQLVNDYPVISIEDGLDESDWQGWCELTRILGDRCQLVGDDLFVTNTQLLQEGIDKHAANAILIKPNQIGTLTETLAAISMAKAAGYATIISHRSGETEDTSIADIAVGTDAGQIKTGSLCRTDRTAKYNQLLRIEAELGQAALYPGREAFPLLGR